MVYVRLSYAKVRSGKLDQLVETFYKNVAPLESRQPGNIVAELLRCVGGGSEDEVISIGVWDTKEHADNWVTNEEHRSLPQHDFLVEKRYKQYDCPEWH